MRDIFPSGNENVNTATHSLLRQPIESAHPLLDAKGPGVGATLIFIAIILTGLSYIGYQLVHEVNSSTAAAPWVLLLLAVLIALGFEFVNGFHDTANAVATVIYTRSLSPQYAVMWSGLWNFIGVMMASGAVAWGIVSLLPVELILQVNSAAGMAMVFSLLAAAIIWNLGTWWLGLPASSSHTLIGSIVGVGLSNQFLASAGAVTSGVDWAKAREVGMALVISPVVGFVVAALLLLLLKLVVRNPALFKEPEPNKAPPWWIRATLIATCTGVSFAHGSNDGQKGMGLIMLILVGVVPAAFALNRTPDPSMLTGFRSNASAVLQVLDARFPHGATPLGDARAIVDEAVRTKQWHAQTGAALSAYIRELESKVASYDSFATVPGDQVSNIRNDLYVVSEALKLIDRKKAVPMSATELQPIIEFHKSTDAATRFIPTWVKVAVAMALGLGTMVGWRRIVVTVGEKIGKSHLTYGQGAAAETVAAVTIGLADVLGLPVSTTHVLSSGIAGTMAANGSGLQWSTVRSIALAWILTLPASALLSGLLFALFRAVF
jgi:inorganic phosphate transporter, PiT family